jgi:Uma2 family endonuclease
MAMPEIKRAELIEGKVYMSSPVRIRSHARPHAKLLGWMHQYEAGTPGVEAADNATVLLDSENEIQPDALMRILPEAGGQTRDSEKGFVEGAPELVAEVAASTASYDLHEKKRVYRRNGVLEYIVWLADEARLEWWELTEGEYASLPVENGIIKSRIFPGLWLAADALLNGESAQVLARVQEGIASKEHAAFAAKLKAKLQPS